MWDRRANILARGGESPRLRWRSRDARRPFTIANVYLPQRLLVEAADYFRRPGEPDRAEPTSTLLLRDRAIAGTVFAMLDVLADEGVDLYAEQAARWLATQLIWVHGGRDPAEDDRSPGSLSDTRLANALEYMTANYSRPLTIIEMARVAAISPFHFCRVFRSAVGVTPHRYLTEPQVEGRPTAARYHGAVHRRYRRRLRLLALDRVLHGVCPAVWRIANRIQCSTAAISVMDFANLRKCFANLA